MLVSEKTKSSIQYAALSGVFFGLAFLTKQLQAFLILLIAITFLAATQRSFRFLFTKRFTMFWGVALLLVSPWLIYMTLRFGGEFWYWSFVYNNIERSTVALEGHVGGVLFYFNYLINNNNVVLMAILPFSAGLCLFNAVFRRIKVDTLLLVWMLIVLLVFTFAQTKLYWYIIPAVPAFVIAISSFLYAFFEKTYLFLKKWVRIRSWT